MERRMERMSRMRVVGLEGRVASYGLDGQESSDRAAFVRRTDSSGTFRLCIRWEFADSSAHVRCFARQSNGIYH